MNVKKSTTILNKQYSSAFLNLGEDIIDSNKLSIKDN